MLFSKSFCQPVIGAINLNGKMPIESELITNPGRVFLISDPIVGSKFISHISPRSIAFSVILEEISLAAFELIIINVMGS